MSSKQDHSDRWYRAVFNGRITGRKPHSFRRKKKARRAEPR